MNLSCSSMNFLTIAIWNSLEVVDLHVLGFGNGKIIMILWWCHVSLITGVSLNFVLSSHLKWEPQPTPGCPNSHFVCSSRVLHPLCT